MPTVALQVTIGDYAKWRPIPSRRPAERDQDAGLYVRAERWDSRRVLRLTDERIYKRVPRRPVAAALSRQKSLNRVADGVFDQRRRRGCLLGIEGCSYC
jgi:hypothetical protein